MKKSFTLLELLIVLVIVAVLAVLAIPQYENFMMRARGVEAMRNLRALSDSLWRYYFMTGKFPPRQPEQSNAEDGYFFYPFPPELDVNIANPSKYFYYLYLKMGEDTIRLVVVDRLNIRMPPTSLPAGFIVAYRLDYLYDVPTQEGQKGEKMDAHWYKYRYYEYIDSDGSFKLRWGWPGEK